MKFEKGQTYIAQINLGFFERLAGNDRVQSELEKAGFTNVKVTGSGSERQAIGLWPHETRTHNSLPEQVGKIRKQNS